MKKLMVTSFWIVIFCAIHCEAMRLAGDTDDCHYKGHDIRNGESKSLQVPCLQATCTTGRMQFEHCESRPLLANDKRCFEFPGVAAPYPSCCPTYACI